MGTRTAPPAPKVSFATASQAAPAASPAPEAQATPAASAPFKRASREEYLAMSKAERAEYNRLSQENGGSPFKAPPPAPPQVRTLKRLRTALAEVLAVQAELAGWTDCPGASTVLGNLPEALCALRVAEEWVERVPADYAPPKKELALVVGASVQLTPAAEKAWEDVVAPRAMLTVESITGEGAERKVRVKDAEGVRLVVRASQVRVVA